MRRLEGDGGKWAISTEGGNRARWSRDEREIVFVSPDGKLMSVEVRLEPEFSASTPRVVLDLGIRRVVDRSTTSRRTARACWSIGRSTSR